MRALLLIIALALPAACQDTPSWRAVPIDGIWCGAVMRSPVLVQVYCYSDSTNKTMGWNLMSAPIVPSRTRVISIALNGSNYEVGDPFNVPIGGIRWDFTSEATGIRWTIRLATPGGAGVVNPVSNSQTGIFTKIYGAP